MDSEGRLTIQRPEVNAIPPLRAQPARSGDFVAITVTDTGGGIAPELLETIFEPFFTTKEGRQGHRPRPQPGVRLCQAIRRRHRGREPPRGGATFTIYLPQAAVPADAVEAAAGGSEPGRARPRLPSSWSRTMTTSDNSPPSCWKISATPSAASPARMRSARSCRGRVLRRPGVFRRHHARHERRRARRLIRERYPAACPWC